MQLSKRNLIIIAVATIITLNVFLALILLRHHNTIILNMFQQLGVASVLDDAETWVNAGIENTKTTIFSSVSSTVEYVKANPLNVVGAVGTATAGIGGIIKVVSSYRTQISNLHNSINTTAITNQQSTSALQDQIKSLQDELTGKISSTTTTLEQTIDGAHAKIANLASEATTIKDQLTGLSNAVDAKIGKQQESILFVADKAGEASKDISTLKDTTTSQANILEDHTVKIEQTKTEMLSSLDKTETELKETLASYQKILDSFKQSYQEDLSKIGSSGQTEIGNIKDSLQKLKDMIDQANQKIVSLRSK